MEPAKGADAPHDIDRLVQDVLAELGLDADAASVAEGVRRLDRGLPAEDEFAVICAWLGRATLVHKLDQAQTPISSRDRFQVPDVLASFDAGGPVLVEVKVRSKPRLSFRPDYLQRLNAYAGLLRLPLLIAWKHHSLWMLFDARHLTLAETNFNIDLDTAMRQNLMGVLVGDVAFTFGPGAAVHFDVAKEEMIDKTDEEDGATERWRMRVADAFVTDGQGMRRHDLHTETQQLLAITAVERSQTHAADVINLSFAPQGSQFAHMVLPHMLDWERRTTGRPEWRRLLGEATIVRSVENLHVALARALREGVIHHVLHQVPQNMPDFVDVGVGRTLGRAGVGGQILPAP